MIWGFCQYLCISIYLFVVNIYWRFIILTLVQYGTFGFFNCVLTMLCYLIKISDSLSIMKDKKLFCCLCSAGV